MERISIAAKDFMVNPHARWSAQWMLLTAGDFQAGHFNTMTVGWGSFGTMWNKPFAQVVVRPTRYTFEFIDRYPTFTLCGLPASHCSALQVLGTVSGRDEDKIAKAGLTPISLSHAAAPGFAEADLIIECQKIYWDDFKPERFLDSNIDNNYPLKDYHRIYFGEILAITGTRDYTRQRG